MAGTNDSSERAYNEALLERVRSAREGARNGKGFTQQEMADLLGIGLDRYKKYELRSPLPPFLFEKMALATGVDINYLLTGKRGHARRIARVSRVA